MTNLEARSLRDVGRCAKFYSSGRLSDLVICIAPCCAWHLSSRCCLPIHNTKRRPPDPSPWYFFSNARLLNVALSVLIDDGLDLPDYRLH
jgi:hypothetical protein